MSVVSAERENEATQIQNSKLWKYLQTFTFSAMCPQSGRMNCCLSPFHIWEGNQALHIWPFLCFHSLLARETPVDIKNIIFRWRVGNSWVRTFRLGSGWVSGKSLNLSLSVWFVHLSGEEFLPAQFSWLYNGAARQLQLPEARQLIMERCFGFCHHHRWFKTFSRS